MIGVDMINQSHTEQGAVRQKCRIALLFGHGNPSHIQISQRLYQLFLQPLFDDNEYEPVLWETYFNRDAVRIKIAQIIQQKFDLVIVVGEACSSFLNEFYADTGCVLPTVYLGIRRSAAETILSDVLARRFKDCVAIVPPDVSEQALAVNIGRFAPYIKKIAIPYYAHGFAGSLCTKIAYVKLYLEQQGIEVYAQPIEDASEGVNFLKQVVSSVDAVFVYEGCGLTTYTAEIAALCWEQRVLFFAGGGEETIDLGASCVYGGSIASCADKAYEVVSECRQRNASLGELPIIDLPYERILMVNEAMAVQCGIPQAFIEELKKEDDVIVWRRWVPRPV